MQAKNLQHEKLLLGAMPIINQVLDRLDLAGTLTAHLRNERYAKAIIVLVKNMLVEPAALYRIPQWSEQFEENSIGIKDLKDDVIGRALDKLFAADRASLQTELTVDTIKCFNIDTTSIHNDSTSIKFSGTYKEQSSKSVKLKRGHSKDHRPDLKQIIYNLSVAEDGAIPIHFKCHDGNMTDDKLHIETWLTLRGVLGKSDFLYVADAKLCTSQNMRKIDKEGGRFVTIVPKTRGEVQKFHDECSSSEVRWVPLTRRKSARKKGKYDVFQIAEGFHQLDEGFRLYWYRSSEKRLRDQESRNDRIEAAMAKLEELMSEPRRGPKTEKSLIKAAQAILERYKATQWINVEVKTREEESFKQTTKGKPGPNATYRRIVKRIPYIVTRKNHAGIEASEAVDGVFPLTTNSKLDAKLTLSAYKYQPYLEKRFSWTKSDYEVPPVFLKKTERIESLMFAVYLADLIAAIIQRQLRNAMKERRIKELRTLPEERPSKTPTWEQLQRLFAQHAKYELKQGEKLVKTFWDKLNPQQSQVLDLLGIPQTEYFDT